MQQALNPPTSIRVLESLASYLTPPLRRSPESRVQSPEPSGPDSGLWTPDSGLREAAYDACAQVIKQHSKSFYFSSRLLPAGKREGITALYAFCRLTDNLVDEVGAAGALPVPREIARAKARLALDSWAKANSGSEVQR